MKNLNFVNEKLTGFKPGNIFGMQSRDEMSKKENGRFYTIYANSVEYIVTVTILSHNETIVKTFKTENEVIEYLKFM